MMKHLVLALSLLLIPASAMAMTYEQAFVQCTQQSASVEGEDHSAAIQDCMKALGFTEAPPQQ